MFGILPTERKITVIRLSMLITLSLLVLGSTSADLSAAAKKKKKHKVIPAEKHMVHVPDADPTIDTSLGIVKELRGVHPRLFLSKEEFQALYKQKDSDPILKHHINSIITTASGIRVNPKGLARMYANANAGVVHALGRLPNLPLAYCLTGDEKLRDNTIALLKEIVSQAHWDTGAEADSGMGGSCVMLLAAMCYDAVYNDLDPEFRDQATQKLFTHARRMYHLGHMKKGLHKVKYWQQDPANNHRWFRNKGLVSCLLAVADKEGIEASWMLEQTKKEIDYVMKWFPDEGDCHESVTYSQFGFAHLAYAITMMDRCLGTAYRKHEGLHEAWSSQVYSFDFKRRGHLSYGDSKNGPNRKWNKTGAFFIGPALSGDETAQAAMVAMHNACISESNSTWSTILYYNPKVKTGSLDSLPKSRLFGDLGVAWMRKDWTDSSPLFMFKCGPYGGFKLNEYRHMNPNKPNYISVAHDDPDANTFAMHLDGQHVAHPSVYDAPKLTANHNTILVNGKGQLGEGSGWTQPIKNKDMRTLSYVTTWKHDKETGRTFVEGEAGNAYPDLKTFRRSVAWLPNEYILILDDITANGQQNIAWNNHSPKAQLTDAASGLGIFEGEAGAQMPFQVIANQPITGKVSGHIIKSPKGNKQVQKVSFSADSDAIQYACVLNPWKKAGLKISYKNDGSISVVHVQGDGIDDVWTWQANADMKTPSQIVCKRGGKEIISISAKDKFEEH